MKKSLSKILARMAKDGDIETVAEIIEEMIEPEAAAEQTAEEVAEAVAEVAEDPAAVVETPEGATIVVDEAALGEVISRLDQIIALLTPAAQDDDPVEEIVEAVEEAVEAAAAAETAAEPGLAEEVAGIVEEILDPDAQEALSALSAAGGDECGEREPEVISTGDALRAALIPMRPALAVMPKRQKARVCAEIQAILRGKPKHAAYNGMVGAADRRPARGVVGPELGRRIMAKRNPNYKE